MAKGGGKAFDIEVDVRDPYAFDLLESVNDIARTQREMIETVSQVHYFLERFYIVNFNQVQHGR